MIDFFSYNLFYQINPFPYKFYGNLYKFLQDKNILKLHQTLKSPIILELTEHHSGPIIKIFDGLKRNWHVPLKSHLWLMNFKSYTPHHSKYEPFITRDSEKPLDIYICNTKKVRLEIYTKES